MDWERPLPHERLRSRAVHDHDAAGYQYVTSTPPQPAYVGLVRSVTVREGQRRAMSEWKMREFKGLTCKLLNNLNYWNRLGLGS